MIMVGGWVPGSQGQHACTAGCHAATTAHVCSPCLQGTHMMQASAGWAGRGNWDGAKQYNRGSC
jgi:hypothetical protein